MLGLCQFLKDYEASKETILGLNISNPDKAKIKKLREGLHISTDLPAISAEIDDIKETLPVDGIRDLFLTTKDMFSVVCTLYYLFGLYKCTNYDKNIKSIEVNYNIVYSLYELIAKNIGTSNGYYWDKIKYDNKIVYLPNKWSIYLP